MQAAGHGGQGVGELEEGMSDVAGWGQRCCCGPGMASTKRPHEMANLGILPTVAMSWLGTHGSRLAPEQPVAPEGRQRHSPGQRKGHSADMQWMQVTHPG